MGEIVIYPGDLWGKPLRLLKNRSKNLLFFNELVGRVRFGLSLQFQSG